MSEIELSAGTVEYRDTGGDGPVLVLLHGLMMDAALWDGKLPPARRYRPVGRGGPGGRFLPVDGVRTDAARDPPRYRPGAACDRGPATAAA
jgi:pimeloyl-ACP methyl ester carboxylesterase